MRRELPCGTCQCEPVWLRTRLPNTPLRECVPASEDLSDDALSLFLQSSPVLQEVVKKSAAELDTEREAHAAERLRALAKDCAAAVSSLDDLVTQCQPTRRQWADAAEALLVQLRPLRSRLEKDAYDRANEALSLSAVRLDRGV